MSKKSSHSKPIGDLPSKEAIRDSKSLNRVMNHGKFEGIFLYKQQLQQLISNIPANANGLWFVIGDTELKAELSQNSTKTVEILPAKYTPNSQEIVIPVNSDLQGKLNSDFEEILRNDTDYYALDILIGKVGPKTPSQRTPPPRPKD